MKSPEELNTLDDEALRAIARAHGLVVGGTLVRGQLLSLVAGLELDGTNEGEEDQVEPAAPEKQVLFRTLTMARLCLQQGLKEEAAAICRELLAQDPNDRRVQPILEGGQELSASPRLEGRAEDPDGSLEISCSGPRSLRLEWALPKALDELASRLASFGAERVLRLHSARFHDRVVEELIRDESAELRSGSLVLHHCWPDAFHRAAIGWRGLSGELTPIVHSAAVETPRGVAEGAPESTFAELIARLR